MIDASFMSHYGFRIEAIWEGEAVVFVKREANGEVWVVAGPDGSGLPSEGGACMLAHYASEADFASEDGFTVWGLKNCGDVISAIREIKLTV